MKYLTKITNKVVVKPNFLWDIERGLKDIQNGKIQRELMNDGTILKCNATGRRLSENSALMELWLYSNVDPTEDIKEAFNAEQFEDDLNTHFEHYELKCEVFDLQNEKPVKIYSTNEVFGNRDDTSHEK